MAKDDSPGFLSKVVRFVRNSGTPWADLEVPDTEADGSYSKQVLKEMVERRRRNDFVRRREFDQLRKLRRRGASADPSEEAPPSFFATSLLSRPDDRAVTLRKIDEIEEQMSRQWWQTRPPEPGDLGLSTPPSAEAPWRPGTSIFRASMMRTSRLPAYAATVPLHEAGLSLPPRPHPPAQPAGARPLDLELPDADADASDVLLPSLALPAAAEEAPLPSYRHDPQLEDAAIRFANGDNAGAEAALLDLTLVDTPTAAEAWSALFDLYRCIGQQERFETAALDFARRYGRSPPAWFALAAADAPPGAAAIDAGFCWQCPPLLGAEAVVALEQSLAGAATPWQLDWSALDAFGDDAAEPLRVLFTRWCGQAIPLWIAGADRLARALQERTPSSNAQVDPAWWRLRMEALRATGQPEEFEMVALDYCVTYEVSPPSWQAVRCDYRAVMADTPQALPAAVPPAPRALRSDAGFATDFPVLTQALTTPAPRAELAGEILGDADAALALLDAAAAHRPEGLEVDCSRLVRMDFSAAGSLLNWAANAQAQGRPARLQDLHRLVAIFANVVGIGEYAQVLVRGD
jgi:ABC-type transporter Mla MlaB component